MLFIHLLGMKAALYFQYTSSKQGRGQSCCRDAQSIPIPLEKTAPRAGKH